MKQILIFLLLTISFMSCKKSETTTSVTETTISDTSGIKTTITKDETSTNLPEQPKPIVLSNKEVEDFALAYDDLLKELEAADLQNNGKAMIDLKSKFAKMDAQTDEMGKKLDGNDQATYDSFIGKRKSAASSIISKY